MALGAALLLGALVFLFVKTAGIDFRHDSQALSLLREMMTLDAHWDDETGRLVNDLHGTTRVSDFSAMIGRTLGEAERGRVHEQQHQAQRWTFLGSGMGHPNFLGTIGEVSPASRKRLEEIAPVFS